ncbi:ABC transporter substrate-binding protein [Aureibacillus halotolerans]|uniref:Iron complex transport system substrate-binding protein n=1 Tax=Aureibacillus halotolerans TaxID=1508390 RepID=A0A4R6TTF0_9BACI|nr:iron-siderophore ABC transporter substrate-binding protein [Aureibacillus halotolerans]TDQ36571.1 iron complex transport system substrate-binding protein [Aureibacillus halotolerans]
MHSYRHPILFIVIALFTILLVGCGTTSSDNESTTAAATSESATSESATETVETEETANSEQGASEERVIQHALGETVISGTPKKIVTLYQGANDIAVALDVQPVGIVESWVEPPVYEYLREDLGDVPVVGVENQPNLEEIYKLQPDLIVASRTRHEAIYEQLSQIAPTIVGKDVFDWKDTVDIMGQGLNKQAEAEQLMSDWDARVSDFKEKMGDRLPIEVTITNFRADHARIFYMGYAGLILKDLGFTRPPGHDSDEWGVKLSSKESIPDMNADMIFNFNTEAHTDATQKNYEEWTSHPLWQQLDAVKNNQVEMVGEVYWNSAGGYISANKMLDEIYAIFELEM